MRGICICGEEGVRDWRICLHESCGYPVLYIHIMRRDDVLNLLLSEFMIFFVLESTILLLFIYLLVLPHPLHPILDAPLHPVRLHHSS